MKTNKIMFKVAQEKTNSTAILAKPSLSTTSNNNQTRKSFSTRKTNSDSDRRDVVWTY